MSASIADAAECDHCYCYQLFNVIEIRPDQLPTFSSTLTRSLCAIRFSFNIITFSRQVPKKKKYN